MPVVHQEKHHRECAETTPIAPCNLLAEVHTDTIDSRMRQSPGSNVCQSEIKSRDRLRLAGAIDVFDSKDNTVVFQNCYDTNVSGRCGETVVAHHKELHRQRDKHTDILFGLISGDHHESSDTRGLTVEGNTMVSREQSCDDRVKFLGITIARSHHHKESHSPNFRD